MDLLGNILMASFILSLISLMVIYFILNSYEIDNKYFVRLFIYLFIVSSVFMYYHKGSIIRTYGYTPVSAAAEVFNEITDSQQLNGVMHITGTTGGNELLEFNDNDLVIDNISSPITCNNKL